MIRVGQCRRWITAERKAFTVMAKDIPIGLLKRFKPQNNWVILDTATGIRDSVSEAKLVLYSELDYND